MQKIIVLLIAVLTTSCSIFQNTEKEAEVTKAEEEVYVFDEVSENETNTESINNLKEEVDKTLNSENQTSSNDSNNRQNLNSFYLQIGAFSTLNRAEVFAKENKTLVPVRLSIIYNKSNALYTVRSIAYSTKEEAIVLRDRLKSRNLFTDSFIITE